MSSGQSLDTRLPQSNALGTNAVGDCLLSIDSHFTPECNAYTVHNNPAFISHKLEQPIHASKDLSLTFTQNHDTYTFSRFRVGGSLFIRFKTRLVLRNCTVSGNVVLPMGSTTDIDDTNVVTGTVILLPEDEIANENQYTIAG